MRFRFLGYFILIIVFSLALTSLALAQSETPALVEAVEIETTEGVIIGGWDSVVSDELEGIEVEEITKAPSGWGLFWRGVKERVSVALIVNPVKKAEKRLKFAEERMAIAEKIVETTDSEKAQEQAEKMITKAQTLMTKAEEKKDKWLVKGGERAEKLLKNMATHQVRVQKSLDRIELHIPEDKLVRWDELREGVETKGRNFVNALQQGNLPEKVREHLQNVKERVETHVRETAEYRTRKRELLQAAAEGDESAKDGLKNLKEDRRTVLEANRERYKEGQEKLQALKKAAQDGDEAAQKKLRIWDKSEDVRDKLEDRRDKREDNFDKSGKDVSVCMQSCEASGGETVNCQVKCKKADIREDVRDRREDVRDRNEDKKDAVFSPGGFGNKPKIEPVKIKESNKIFSPGGWD